MRVLVKECSLRVFLNGVLEKVFFQECSLKSVFQTVSPKDTR